MPAAVVTILGTLAERAWDRFVTHAEFCELCRPACQDIVARNEELCPVGIRLLATWAVTQDDANNEGRF